MPTEHSWLAKVILESEDLEETEEQLNQQVTAMSPEYTPTRMVRETGGLWLEHKAIAEWLPQHLEWRPYLLLVESPEEAMDVASMELNGVSPQEKEMAVSLLKQLESNQPQMPQSEE